MIIDHDAIEDMTFVSITKVHSMKLRDRSKEKKGQTKVVFGSIYTRDLVMSHASNLPNDWAVDIVVPNHLLSLKKTLEAFAYKVRKYAKEDNTKCLLYIHLSG